MSLARPLPLIIDEGGKVRFIGMDVHRDFCEVAIAEQGGKVRQAGRIASTVEQLRLFARSLALDDDVALEATSGAGLIADLIRPHVGQVVVANTRRYRRSEKRKRRPIAWTPGCWRGSPRAGL